MKSQKELNQELRQRILALPDVTEKPHAGIHEDAFFVNKKMFMHIHAPPSGLKSVHAARRRTLVILHVCTLRYI